MVASPIQKLAGLSPTHCLGLRLLLPTFLVLSGCAGQLRTSEELGQGPIELHQDIKTADLSTIQKAPEPLKDTTVPEVDQKSKSKKGEGAPKVAVKKIKKKAAEIPTGLHPGAPEWSPQSWPFGIGEKMVLTLRWGVIEGGVVTMEVKEPKVIEGETVLHYAASVHSSKMLEFFYKIDDSVQSFVGLADHLPRRQEIQQLESARAGRRLVVFDQKANKAKFFSSLTKKDGSKEDIRRDDDLALGAQDIFGAIYFYRFVLNLKGANFPIHDRWRNWNSELTYVGKEQITVPAGPFATEHYKVKPRIQGVLEPKGDVDVWITDDSRRAIVQFKANIKLGSITGELREYSPGTPITLPLPKMITPTNLTAMGELAQ